MKPVLDFGVNVSDHMEAVAQHHRFVNITFQGQALDLSHLDAFALRVDPELGAPLDVIVLFSCHCFTVSFKRDGRGEPNVPLAEIFDNGRERRVLCARRYAQSKGLPGIIKDLPNRTIQIAAVDRQNFVTFDVLGEQDEVVSTYAVFFEVTRDKKRKKRLLLHVQSAYVPDQVTKRQSKAGKVSFSTLLRNAYLGRKIRG